MNRYVDADEMIVQTLRIKTELKCDGVSVEGIIKYLEENATYDVQEVRHGKFKIKYTDGFHCGERNYKLICPFCDFSYLDNHCGAIVPKHFNYCPNCGAKMDDDLDCTEAF